MLYTLLVSLCSSENCKNFRITLKLHLKVLVNELSSVKSNLLCILNVLDLNHVSNIIISNNKKSIVKHKFGFLILRF